jgi:transcriptional regulator GlxA family with amidase domain
VSERTLARLFGRAIGLTPLRYQQLLRIERAEHLIGHGTTVEAAARAVGFEDARMLRRLRQRARHPVAALPRPRLRAAVLDEGRQPVEQPGQPELEQPVQVEVEVLVG